MEKPHVEAKTAPAPEDVVIADLIEGDGPEAQPDGYVEVHYVGVDSGWVLAEWADCWVAGRHPRYESRRSA